MKYRFTTTAEQILAKHSGWSGVRCETCGRVTTKAAFAYSMRFYKKSLCRVCQSVEKQR